MYVLRACLRRNGGPSIGGIGGRALSTRASPATAARLSSPLAAAVSTRPLPRARTLPSSSAASSRAHARARVRPLSSSSGGGGFGGNGGDDDDDGDILLRDEESLPTPPSYVRDAVTGKWTDKTQAELGPSESRLLKLDDEGRDEVVMDRLADRWKKAASDAGVKEGGDGGADGLGTPNAERGRVARRVQEQQLALGTIGRNPSSNIPPKDGEDAGDVDTDKPLTPREYQALKTYAQKEHGIHPRDLARAARDDPELIPHNVVSSGAEGSVDSSKFFDADLDLAYLNPRLNRRAFREETDDDGYDPFADLLPSDLNPARKVNRQHAKPIPRRLLHHNNLALLRRYTTPGGKIMNRVQSRLGAKDQRKIAKLVKRARHLGLIPHLGQWKFEDHGHLHERGLVETDQARVGEEAEGKRSWEVELEQRGLWPLQDETELVKRYYDMEGIMDHLAGPKGGKKREELEELLGGAGALVKGSTERAATMKEGSSMEGHEKGSS